MTVIKGTTKRGEAMLMKAYENEGFSLEDVYGKTSFAKQDAWEYCFRKCESEHGEDFHIISHNTFSFSVAWYVENGVRIETANNSYLILYPKFC